MKYKILYDTQISNKFYKKDSFIQFNVGTDEFFIQRLINQRIIENLDSDFEDKKPSTKAPKNKKSIQKPSDVKADIDIDTDETKENQHDSKNLA